MMYLKLTIYYGCLILLCRTNTILNKKDVYCGKKLINILKQFCLELPTYHTDALLIRKKRQIVKECCKNKCSLNYLLDNYCQINNTSALEAFTNKQNDSTTSTTIRKPLQPTMRYQIKEYTTTKSTFSERRTHRRKRNCKCREILNRNRVLNEERRLLEKLRNRKVPILQPEIGEVEFRQRPFYMILS